MRLKRWLCQWLYRHKLHRQSEIMSPGQYWKWVGEDMSRVFFEGLEAGIYETSATYGSRRMGEDNPERGKRQTKSDNRQTATTNILQACAGAWAKGASKMTLKELSQHYYLTREIEADQQRLEELSEAAVAPSSSDLSGMPRAPRGIDSKVERMTAEIVDLQAVITARQQKCIRERVRLERWINDIPDSLTRQIFYYRFVENMNWVQVALHVGGGNTVNGVRQRVYRHLRADAAGEN